MSKMEQLQSQLETATEEKDAAIKEAAEVGEKLVQNASFSICGCGFCWGEDFFKFRNTASDMVIVL